MTEEDIKKKVLEEYDKGNICYRTIEGIMTMPKKDFVKQPLEGMLYDINRDKATILSFLDDSKWVNDLALTELLRYYYELSKEFERRLKQLPS